MPAAGRLADIGSGHGCFPPSPTAEGSGDVFTNARPALRKGDAVMPHGCGQCPPHGRSVSAGSATVNINNRPASRVGDAISCGGSVSTGSGDVFIGDDTWGQGTGDVKPSVRFVLSQIPGSADHSYYKEPYKLFHNDGLVQEGITDEKGVITFAPDEVTGVFRVEAVGRIWTLDVRGLAPADTPAGVDDRLAALGYTIADEGDKTALSPDRNEATGGLGWFQAARDEDEASTASERVTNFLKALLP